MNKGNTIYWSLVDKSSIHKSKEKEYIQALKDEENEPTITWEQYKRELEA